MIAYSLTSEHFKGEVIFRFNDEGLLINYDASTAELSEEQLLFLLKRLPRELPEIEKLMKVSSTAKMLKIDESVTFEMFWDRYNEKVRSSKKKAIAKWNRMTQKDRIKAYYFINKYEMSISTGVSKKYAETYLNAELWNN